MAHDTPCESLVELLDVRATGDGAYTADLGDFWGDTMAEDAIARAALAAARSHPELELVSLQGHVESLALASPLAIRLDELERSSDLLRLRIQLSQNESRGAFDACFTAPGTGPSHQDIPLPPDLPAPEDVPSTVECARSEGWPEEYARGPLEFRRIGPLWPDPAKGEPRVHRCWLSPREPLGEDPALHAAARVFATSFYRHWEFERRLGRKFAHARFRLLDRSFHLHGAARWYGWWLLDAHAEIARDGLARSTRRLFDRAGTLLASATSHARVATL